MKRKRITQLFPFLLPIRRIQRKIFFDATMRFDYTEKYTLKTSKIHMPARIDPDTAERIKQTASVIYRALDCSGFRLSRCLVHHD